MPTTPKRVNKTQSTYTYTGCWTCRRRHIKCSEEKPACNRCIKAGFECGGYDFRFGSSRSFRRPVDTGRSTQRAPALTSAEVNGILDELDTATNSRRQGPFSVLSFISAATAAHLTSREPHTGQARDVVLRDGNLRLQSPTLSSDIASRSSSPEDVKTVATSYPLTPMAQEPHVLTVSARSGELFEHWTSFLCNNMSPLPTSSANPFRYLYPSLALEGLIVTPDMGAARLAVFHAICGTAAWSLSKMKPEDPSYHALSVNHDQLALKYIQQTIEQPDGLRDIAIPAAIMTCLTGDIVSGRLDLWGQHLRGGFRCLLNVLTKQKTVDSTTSSLCQQYLLGAAFGGFGSSSELRMLQDGILNEDLYIEECHCITRPLLDTLVTINVLAASNTRKDPAETEKVRRQLLQSVPRVNGIFRHHLAHVYYYAISIHFTRMILQSTDTHQLVSSAIDHLEWAAETGQGKTGQITMWPLLIIGPECKTRELQARLFNWCNSQLRTNVGNLSTFIKMLQKTYSVARSLTASETKVHSLSEFKREEAGGVET